MKIQTTHPVSHYNFKESLVSALNNKISNSQQQSDSASFNYAQQQSTPVSNEKSFLTNKNIAVGTAIGAMAILVATAFYKRKNIAALFKKSAPEIKQEVEKQVEKFKLPEPVFAKNATAERHAEEKANYIQSIWDEFIDISETNPMVKEKNLLGLKALNEYGTLKDFQKLPSAYKYSGDEDIYLGYIKFLNKVALESDEFISLKNTLKSKEQISENIAQEIIKGLKEYGVDTAPRGYWRYYDNDLFEALKSYSNKYKKNETLKKNADALMERMQDDVFFNKEHYNSEKLGERLKKSNEAFSLIPKKGHKLPKPVFTPNASPETLAKEKADYINSIWSEYILANDYKLMNKEKNLLGLEVLNKYGTNADLKKLIYRDNSYVMPSDYGFSIDDDIVRELAKFIKKSGKEHVDFKLLEYKLNERQDIYSEKTIEEIFKALKKFNVDMARKGSIYKIHSSLGNDIEYFMKKYQDNEIIVDNGKALLKNIVEENPGMSEGYTAPASAVKEKMLKETKHIFSDKTQNIKLPQPKFTEGASNELLEKEKKAYLDSIWDEYVYVNPPYTTINKEKALLGLEAVEEYGNRADFKDLPSYYHFYVEDEDMLLSYAKIANKVGNDTLDFSHLRNIFDQKGSGFGEELTKELVKSLKKSYVDLEDHLDSMYKDRMTMCQEVLEKFKDNKEICNDINSVLNSIENKPKN